MMKTKQTEMWEIYHKQIENLIEKEGFENCLQWEPILKAVFVGNAPHIRAKARLLFNGDNLFRRITNKKLAIDPGLGNPTRLPDYKFTSGARVNMLWHLKSLLFIFGEDLSRYETIFEFGGGVGYLADMLFRLGFSGEYYLYDVPVMSRIQKWYLDSLGRDVKCISDLSRLVTSEDSTSVFVGLMSFTEIPLKERKKVEPIIFDSDLIFIAYATEYGGINNSKYIAYLAERLYDYEIKINDIDPWRKGKKYFMARLKNES